MKIQKLTAALLSLFVAIFLAGCSGGGGSNTNAKATQENYDKIKDGMTKAEVTALLGEPTGTVMLGQINDQEVRGPFWEGRGFKIVVGFDSNDKVVAKRMDKE